MKIGKKSMPINRLILIIDDNRCQLIDWYRQSMTIDANRWQSIITHTWTIDCSSIININRLIGIDCHRMPSIPIDHRFHRLGTPCLSESLERAITRLRLWYKVLPFEIMVWFNKSIESVSYREINNRAKYRLLKEYFWSHRSPVASRECSRPPNTT